MDDFIASFPDDVRKKAEEVAEKMKTFKPLHQIWNDVLLIPAFSMEAGKYAYDHWMPRKGDVFVTGFPKCGSHWLCEAVKQIYFIHDDKMLEIMNGRGKGLLSVQEELDMGPVEKFAVADQFPCPRIMFTHLPEKLVNFEKMKAVGAKIMYIYRNPKDMAVSYFHFYNKAPLTSDQIHLRTNDFGQYLDVLWSGQIPSSVPAGEWYPYHIKSWMKHKGEDNVLFVSFESLKKDFASQVSRIAKFLDVERTQEEIAEITRRCTFEQMKKAEINPFLSKIQLFRKGQVGEWKEYFTAAQSERMDKKLEEELEGVDIEFEYEI